MLSWLPSRIKKRQKLFWALVYSSEVHKLEDKSAREVVAKTELVEWLCLPCLEVALASLAFARDQQALAVTPGGKLFPMSFLLQQQEREIQILAQFWPYLLPPTPVQCRNNQPQSWPTELGEAKFDFTYVTEKASPCSENMAVSKLASSGYSILRACAHQCAHAMLILYLSESLALAQQSPNEPCIVVCCRIRDLQGFPSV